VTVVRIPPVLRQDAGGAREVSSRLPQLGGRIYEDGEIRPFVNVYVDGEDVRTREGLETPIRNGATVILLPAMAGGR
jgi:molybdopterin converting factor small subunit